MKLQDITNQYLTSKFTFNEENGNVLDSVGSAIGTVTGATRVQGFSGKALSFDGVDDNVVFSSKVIPIGEKSIRLKIKLDKPTSNAYVFSNADSSTTQGDRLTVQTDGTLRYISQRNNSTARFDLISNNDICDNQWHDILLVWNGTTDTNNVKMYIDDMVTPNVVGTALSTETISQTYNLSLGSGGSGSSGFLKLQLDEFEVYNKTIDDILNKKYLVLENDKSYYSLADKTLIHLPNASSKNMILHGIEAGKEVKLDEDFDKIFFLSEEGKDLGVGKVFEIPVQNKEKVINSHITEVN